MSDPKPPREELEAALGRLLGEPSSMPTSGFGRLARTARTGLGIGMRVALGRTSATDMLPLVRSLGELKGLSMKLGQILSYVDATLPPEVRQVFSVLQTWSPPAEFDKIASIVREELGERADLLLQHMNPKPLAAASIGQVHRARLPDAGEVAVKVQYPEIEEAIRNDFRAAKAAVHALSRLAPGTEDFVEEARARLSEECDYLREAAQQKRFARWYADHPVLRVPPVVESYSSHRVLTTGFCEGQRFDEWLAQNPSQAERDRVGEALYEFYLGSLYRYGVFNADPHPGNYLLADDGGVVMLDYGCVREFSEAELRSFAALRRAVMEGNRARIREALLEVGASPGNERQFERVCELLRAFFGMTIEDRRGRIDMSNTTELRQMMADKKTILRLRLPAKFLFLFRIKFGLHAVLASLGAEANWRRLEDGFLGD